MKLSELAKKVIGTVAPTLGTALGGPLGGLAGSVLSRTLGAGADDKVEELLATQAPDTLQKIKQAEQQYLAELKRLDIDEQRVHAADRDSARARQIALKDVTPAALAYLVTAGFFGTIGYMLKYGVPAEGGEALLVMLGSLGTAWVAIVTYYFGSSKGSSDKTRLLAEKAQP